MGTSLLGSEYRTLWKAIRRPMLRWWRRVGVWLVVVMVAVGASLILNSYLSFRSAYSSNYAQQARWAIRSILYMLPLSLMLPVIWLWAATTCNRLLSPLLDEDVIPGSLEFARARFLILYAHGIVPLGVFFLVNLIGSFLVEFNYFQPNTLGADVPLTTYADTLLRVIHASLSNATFMAWIVGLLVLLPKVPFAAWGVIGASLVGALASRPVFYFFFYYLNGVALRTEPIEVTFWGWLFSALLVITLFTSVKRKAWTVARVCYSLMTLGLLLRNATGYVLVSEKSAGAYAAIKFLLAFPSFLFNAPLDWHGLATAADNTFPASETALGQMAHLLPLIVEPLWALGILALIYYVILGPWPPWRSAEASATAQQPGNRVSAV
jgi:hypothetical protein